MNLNLARIDKPSSAQKLAFCVIEHLEKQNVDGEAAIVQIIYNALATRIQGRGDNYNLIVSSSNG